MYLGDGLLMAGGGFAVMFWWWFGWLAPLSSVPAHQLSLLPLGTFAQPRDL